MKNILKKLRNENFKDLKEETYKDGKKPIDGIVTLDMINDIDLYETRLFIALDELSLEQLKEVTYYMLAGRELSRYYGTKGTMRLKEYYEYFKEEFQINGRLELIEYIALKGKAFNNYIDTVLRYM